MEGEPKLWQKQFINQNLDDDFKGASSAFLQGYYQNPPTKTKTAT